MKRVNNLYNSICSIENLLLADKKARKGKSGQHGVRMHDKRRGCNVLTLHNLLLDKHFKTSGYNKFTLYDPKEREISGLPYYPDRIVHHAIMNKLEAVFTNTFTTDTYSCIKGKGIHSAQRAVEKALKDTEATQFCLKLDIRKFYPSIDHGILKQLLRRKIKDNDLLWLLEEIIDSAPGVPIGNYLSQYFANFYLCYFDHWIKEALRVKYYFRYADDMVILSGSKAYLHELYKEICLYLQINLKLNIKANNQVFPVDARSIDFVGYRFYHTHTLLRKSIKKSFARAFKRRKNRKNTASLNAYYGWAKHCNSRNLIKKLKHEHI